MTLSTHHSQHGFAAKLFVALLLVATLSLIYLDSHIREQFEGKRWAVPAKVYARPLELYVGAPLSLADLKIELRGLGYQFVSQVNRPGQAAFAKQRAVVHSRGFSFNDGDESSRKLILTFSGDILTGLTNYQVKISHYFDSNRC